MATVLKTQRPDDSVTAARNVTGLAGFNLDDLADIGRSRLDECRNQIRHLLDTAKQDAEQIREQAKQQGYQDGLVKVSVDNDRKIKETAETLASDSLKVMHDAVQKLHIAHQDWMTQYAETLSSIAVAAAEKIVQRKLIQEPEILVRWVDQAVRSTRSATQLTIAVHPETLANLGQTLDELLAAPDLPEQTMVEPDESVPIDAVVVRQPGGEIRVGLREQIERLTELLS